MRRSLCGAVLAPASLLYLAPEMYGLGTESPFIQVVAFRPYFAAAQLLLAVVAVVFRRRWWPACALVGGVAVLMLSIVLPRAVAGPPVDHPATDVLSVLSFNVLDGEADVVALASAVSSYRPDLVVLPEAGADYRLRLDRMLKNLHYRSWISVPKNEQGASGIVVLTAPRLGRVSTTELKLSTRFRGIQLTGAGLGDITVAAVHTASPTPQWLPDWAPELSVLQQWCTEGRGANIVVGDVNATLDHAPLRAAVPDCLDAASESGQGLVATWPTRWPRWFGVQIDHVFMSGGIRASGVWVLDLPGSDHRAVLAQLVLPAR